MFKIGTTDKVQGDQYNSPSPGFGQQGNQQGYTVVVGQPAVANVVVTARPNSHLGFAVFTCLCCFFPTGIAAIVFACMSQSSSDRMDYAKAQEEGNIAKILSIISLAVGLGGIVSAILYVIIVFVYFASFLNSIRA